MSGQAYRIKQWWRRHSSGEQRRLGGKSVLMPTDFDSEGLAFLMRTAEGRSAFSIYVLLSEFAGKLPDAIGKGASSQLAGVLFNDRGPFTPERLASKIPANEKVIGAALQLLMSPQVGWIDQVDCPVPSGYLPDHEPPEDFRDPPGEPPESSRNYSGSRPRARTGAAAAAALSSSEAKKAAAALQLLGVTDEIIGEIFEARPGLTLAHVIAHWHADLGKKHLTNPVGALAKRVKGWEPPSLSGAALIAAARRTPPLLIAVVLDSTRFELTSRKFGDNPAGLWIDDQLAVPTSRLQELELE